MSRSFIVFILCAFIMVSVAFFFVLYQGSALPNQAPTAAAPAGPAGPVVPPPPQIEFVVQVSKGGNTLLVTWENLPEGTIALDIFESKKGKNDWKLWHTIPITPDLLAGGSMTFALGKDTLDKYTFFVQAVSVARHVSTSTVGTGTNQEGQGILWTSAITQAIITTSTLPGIPGNGTGGGTTNNKNGNSNSTTSVQNTTTTNQANNNTPTSSNPVNNNNNTTSSSNGGNNAPTPSGTPYYTPEIKISGYGQSPGGSFWVQHIDQKIQIGWQNLPPPTTRVEVIRSIDPSGPWTTVLIQQNPILVGPYAIQVVDDTVGRPYYYDLNDDSGSTTIGTYGPVYLPPVGQ